MAHNAPLAWSRATADYAAIHLSRPGRCVPSRGKRSPSPERTRPARSVFFPEGRRALLTGGGRWRLRPRVMDHRTGRCTARRLPSLLLLLCAGIAAKASTVAHTGHRKLCVSVLRACLYTTVFFFFFFTISLRTLLSSIAVGRVLIEMRPLINQ